jgi:signal transduction histidine kinase
MSAGWDERDAVNEAVAVVPDRLRKPLTAIVAQVEMLIGGDYGALSAEQRDALEMVRRNNARLLCVIEDAERSVRDRL